jgi:hypothetical protein
MRADFYEEGRGERRDAAKCGKAILMSHCARNFPKFEPLKKVVELKSVAIRSISVIRVPIKQTPR